MAQGKAPETNKTSTQKLRSLKNKERRIARQYKSQGTKNPGHIRHLLRNRLKRLERRIEQGVSAERKHSMNARIKELRALLNLN
jgi:hypothetical protein